MKWIVQYFKDAEGGAYKRSAATDKGFESFEDAAHYAIALREKLGDGYAVQVISKGENRWVENGREA